MLVQKNVNRKLKEYREIVDLMKSAFPKEERIPVWWMNLLAKKNNVDFTAFYDEDEFCGITYTIETERMIFLLYFTVSEKFRSSGYGSKILTQLKENAPQKEIILDVEKPDIKADNYNQRIRRIAFYKRNDFYVSDYTLSIAGIDYQLLSTRKSPDIHEFEKIISKYRMGTISRDIMNCARKE